MIGDISLSVKGGRGYCAAPDKFPKRRLHPAVQWKDGQKRAVLLWVFPCACRPSDAGCPPWALTASTWWWRPKTVCSQAWSTSSATTSWAGWTSSSQEGASMFSSWFVKKGCSENMFSFQLLNPSPRICCQFHTECVFLSFCAGWISLPEEHEDGSLQSSAAFAEGITFFFLSPSLSPISLMFSLGDSFLSSKSLNLHFFGGDTRLSVISRKYPTRQIKVNLQGFCLRAF